MDMKTFHSLHVLRFRVQSQHELHFQGQRVCSYSLTVTLQPDWPGIFTLSCEGIWDVCSGALSGHLLTWISVMFWRACLHVTVLLKFTIIWVTESCMFVFPVGREQRLVLTLSKGQCVHSFIKQLLLTETRLGVNPFTPTAPRCAEFC